jgi:hypothetical protein
VQLNQIDKAVKSNIDKKIIHVFFILKCLLF